MLLDRDVVRKQAKQAIARRTLQDFNAFVDPEYDVTLAHSKIINEYLDALAAREIHNLLVLCPPQNGKSTLVSQRFPAYMLGKSRGKLLVATSSYSIDIARKNSRASRALLLDSDRWPFPDVQLDASAQSVDEWYTTAKGSVKAVGAGGSLTGFGANCLRAGTLLHTPTGMRSIEAIAGETNSVKVLSWDCDRIVYRDVVAAQTIKAEGYVRVRTASGRMVEATSDHRFFTKRGWVDAENLATGDILLRAVRRDRNRAGVQHDKARQAVEERARRYVLRKALCESVSIQRPTADSVLSVWHSGFGSGQAPRDVKALQCRMPTGIDCAQAKAQGSIAAPTGTSVSVLQPRIPADAVRCGVTVLQPRVREQDARVSDGRDEQSRLAQRCEPGEIRPSVGASVPENASADYRARSRRVRRVREWRAVASASHQYERSRQPLVEPSHALQGLPRNVACEGPFEAESDYVAVVERVCEPTVVYDIQVSGTECFFANDILVHNCIIIDDPLKGMAEADSLVISDKTWEWYQTTVSTRQRANVQKCLVQTRWRDNDLAGRILNTPAGKDWTVLTLRAFAEEDDPLGRAPGEVLWPGGPRPLDPAKGEISPRAFAALYQQRPLPAEGALFKASWMGNRYTTLPDMKQVAIFIDGAWKTGLQNDYSAIAVWGTDGVNYYLIHAWHGRVEYPELRSKVTDVFHRFESSLGTRPMVCVEDAASGTALVQELRRTTHIPIVGLRAKGDKYSRAEAVTGPFEAQKVFLPAHAEWLDAWIDEHLRFPVGDHDDFCDTTSGGLGRLISYVPLTFSKLRTDTTPQPPQTRRSAISYGRLST